MQPRSDTLVPSEATPPQIQLRAGAHDASHFLLTPEELSRPEGTQEVATLLQRARTEGRPVTFRSGGSSLSGQAVSSGILADVRRNFRSVEVLDGGQRVRSQPGVTLRQVNAHLLRHGRKLGPDPASDGAATIGGVVANNSSGMSCGTRFNTYRTLDSMEVMLPSGTVIDTGARDADDRLAALEPRLHRGLGDLRARVLDNPHAVAKIHQQFSMKNTMGYGVNSLIDFDTPVEILEHLMIGSEGTLGFIASATLETIPVYPHSASALLVFKDLFSAASVLPELIDTGAVALELMDATSLRVGQKLRGAPEVVRSLKVTAQAALLVEYEAATVEELRAATERFQRVASSLPVDSGLSLTTDSSVRQQLWTLRKGLYTSVAGSRPPGSTALLEDVVVPVEALAQTCTDLTSLFEQHHYENAVIFGHAKDGNIHFMLTDDFSKSAGLKTYQSFTEDMVDVILGHHGSLKAEHGTGRTMAPFVRRQYGDFLYDVMREIKDLFDPSGTLNPDTILTEDSLLYLKDIKSIPSVHPDIDRCTACGYCEPVCPSKDLTLTPRQRIASLREIVAANQRGDQQLARTMNEEYSYEGVDTCAVDGMCGTVCPLAIDTGNLVRLQRRKRDRPLSDAAWSLAANHWGLVTKGASVAMDVAHALPTTLAPPVIAVDELARRVMGEDLIPLWDPSLPAGGHSRQRPSPPETPTALYLPACVNTMFGPEEGPGVQVAFEGLCQAAGISVVVPPQIDSLCCGTVWSSKGVPQGYEEMRARVLPLIQSYAGGAGIPVVCDAASCTEGFAKMLATDPELKVDVMDAVAFVRRHVLPRLPELPKLESLTLHPTCSSKQIGIEDDLLEVGSKVAEEVIVPINWGCCAFAGDRGMLHPELTRSATQAEAAEVRELDSEAHASCNRTCELGMTRATGNEYRHILELLYDQLC